MVRARAIRERARLSACTSFSWRVASWKRRSSTAWVLSVTSFVSSSAFKRRRSFLWSLGTCRHFLLLGLEALAHHEPRLDRELVRREAERRPREREVDAGHLEQDPSGLHDRDPVVGRALAGAHPRLGGLARDRLVGEHADPHLSTALQVVDDGAPRGLDLPGRHERRLLCLQRIVAERDGRAGVRDALHPAALELAVLEPLGHEHAASSPPPARWRVPPVRVVRPERAAEAE